MYFTQDDARAILAARYGTDGSTESIDAMALRLLKDEDGTKEHKSNGATIRRALALGVLRPAPVNGQEWTLPGAGAFGLTHSTCSRALQALKLLDAGMPVDKLPATCALVGLALKAINNGATVAEASIVRAPAPAKVTACKALQAAIRKAMDEDAQTAVCYLSDALRGAGFDVTRKANNK